MKRYVTAITVTAALALPAGAAGDEGRDYQRYGKVRDKLTACSLDRNWRHLGPVRRKSCKGLRRRYALYSFFGSASTMFIICKTRRCVPRVYGVPNPRGRAPRGAVRVY